MYYYYINKVYYIVNKTYKTLNHIVYLITEFKIVLNNQNVYNFIQDIFTLNFLYWFILFKN